MLVLNGIIYSHEIPFIWRFVKKNILCYYVYTGDSRLDKDARRHLEDAIKIHWNPYFSHVGYNVELVDGGVYDISVMWQSLGQYTYGLTYNSGIIGYCNNLPIPRHVRVFLNQNHLPDGAYANYCKFELAGNYFLNPGEVSLISVIQHELGHAWGLGHSIYTHSIMYPPYRNFI